MSIRELACICIHEKSFTVRALPRRKLHAIKNCFTIVLHKKRSIIWWGCTGKFSGFPVGQSTTTFPNSNFIFIYSLHVLQTVDLN